MLDIKLKNIGEKLDCFSKEEFEGDFEGKKENLPPSTMEFEFRILKDTYEAVIENDISDCEDGYSDYYNSCSIYKNGDLIIDDSYEHGFVYNQKEADERIKDLLVDIYFDQPNTKLHAYAVAGFYEYQYTFMDPGKTKKIPCSYFIIADNADHAKDYFSELMKNLSNVNEDNEQQYEEEDYNWDSYESFSVNVNSDVYKELGPVIITAENKHMDETQKQLMRMFNAGWGMHSNAIKIKAF